jgi:hypothetical protein
MKVLVLISGIFSLLLSCSSSSVLSEKDKLIDGFFKENIIANNGEKVYVAIISSGCDDCIKTNAKIIQDWESKGLDIKYMMDENMLNGLSKYLNGIEEKTILVTQNSFFKYGITDGRMLIMYSNDNMISKYDLISEKTQSYSFK